MDYVMAQAISPLILYASCIGIPDNFQEADSLGAIISEHAFGRMEAPIANMTMKFAMIRTVQLVAYVRQIVSTPPAVAHHLNKKGRRYKNKRGIFKLYGCYLYTMGHQNQDAENEIPKRHNFARFRPG